MSNRAVAPFTHAPRSMTRNIDTLTAPAKRAFTKRLATLVDTLGGDSSLPLAECLDVVSGEVGHAADLVWLSHAVLAGQLPTDEEMGDLLVRARLGGTWAALAPLLERLEESERLREVVVRRDTVTCDVHTTSGSDFLSGIQRVVRETTTRWSSRNDVEFVGWVNDRSALRPISNEGRRRLFGHPEGERHEAGLAPIIVPWESCHLWVEVITDMRSTARLLALTKYSRNEVGVLGYDSIPVTSSATVAEAMTSHFARSMAAARQADRVAMISDAATQEYRGVLAMGAGRRDHGPEVAAVPLAVAAATTSEADLVEAAEGLVVEGMPMLLVVGSHEPRKNHLAILHAAELLWREGLRFTLVLVGAGSWNSAEYEQTVSALLGAGRPIQSIRALPDRLLWAAYRLAHCTLFPSLNEGFGLPVAESLAVGTPVITSDFGSMRDIVAPNGTPLGGLLIDPRDDRSLTDAMRSVLIDGATYQRLKAETAEHTERGWDEYADELWAFLVDGVPPSRR